MSETHSRLCRILSVAAGVAIVGMAFVPSLLWILEDDNVWHAQLVAGLLGCVFAVLGLVSRNRKLLLPLGKISLGILTVTFVLGICELAFRLIGFDFARLDKPGNDVPIYYRKPTLHAGEGIFRRPGPDSWRGKVLCAYMHLHGASDGTYSGEQPVLAEYDSLGFRNPPDLQDWEVVVTGDSFVELGYLPYDDLFTTIAAKQLGIRVKNLGVAGTGTISQTFYAKHYGKAPSTRDAVLCFFEGNDLEDLSRELRNTQSFRATGNTWEHRRQVSFLRAVYDRLRRLLRRRVEDPLRTITPNALLVTVHPERPMTVYGIPPVWAKVPPKKRQQLVQILANWAETARAKGMRPWLMYLPDSHRVFHGLMRFTDTNSLVSFWNPGEFAGPLGATCTNLGIQFIDAFPALRHEAEAGRVPYNIIGDTHLSVQGTHTVANVLAEALKPSYAR